MPDIMTKKCTFKGCEKLTVAGESEEKTQQDKIGETSRANDRLGITVWPCVALRFIF